jgi:hypothetical protein
MPCPGIRGRQWNSNIPLAVAAASNWHDAAEKARYLLDLFAATLAAQDPRGQKTNVHPQREWGQGGKGSIEKQSREEEAEIRKEQEEERSSRLGVYASEAYRKKQRRQEVLIVFALIGSPPGINASRKGNFVSWLFAAR